MSQKEELIKILSEDYNVHDYDKIIIPDIDISIFVSAYKPSISEYEKPELE